MIVLPGRVKKRSRDVIVLKKIVIFQNFLS